MCQAAGSVDLVGAQELCAAVVLPVNVGLYFSLAITVVEGEELMRVDRSAQGRDRIPRRIT